MTGIEIISEELYRSTPWPVMIIGSIFIILLCVALHYLCWKSSKELKSKHKVWKKALVLPFAVDLFVIVILVYCALGNGLKIRYTVLIDESASFIEVMNTYKIISNDGPFYTVELLNP